MHNILVCDDERDIVAAIKIYLTAEGYNVFCASNGDEALEVISKNDIQLVIMDIMMPKTDGITAMLRLREEYNMPVILLTAKSEDSDKILGLNLGADDYVTKPFNPIELIARVKSQLRRYTLLGANVITPDIITMGTLELDTRSKCLKRDGVDAGLTPTEYEIASLLIKNKGRVFSPKEIYVSVRNSQPFGAENTIAVHIRHLREKIEINPAEPRYLKVVWGQGYKMEDKK